MLCRSERKKIVDGEITQTTNTAGKANTKTYIRDGRSTRQWMAANLFSSFGAVFYWTIPPKLDYRLLCQHTQTNFHSFPNHWVHRLCHRLHSNSNTPREQP
jgi:hypothetical protein